jgi:lipoate-protein ligase A
VTEDLLALDVDNWFLLPYAENSGQENMDLDHFLATNFTRFSKPILRFYGWKPACISLGFHQKESQILPELAMSHGVDVVRRPTGGRAIYHENELTYSIVYPINKQTKFELYRMVNDVFQKAFLPLYSTELETKSPNLAQFYKQKDSFSCFATSAKNELKLSNKKMVGSAQRLYPYAILQHGSIMLGTEHLKLVDYLNIEPYHRESFRQELEKKTTFLSLAEVGWTKTHLIETICEKFETNFGIRTFEKLTLEQIHTC